MADTRFHHSFEGVEFTIHHARTIFKELDLWIKESVMDYNIPNRLNACLGCICGAPFGTPFEKCNPKISYCEEDLEGDVLELNPLSYVATIRARLAPLPASISIELVNQQNIASDAVSKMSLDIPFLGSLHLNNCRFVGLDYTSIDMPNTRFVIICLPNYNQQTMTWEEDDSGNIVRRLHKANQLITLNLEEQGSTVHHIWKKDGNDLIKLVVSREEFCRATETASDDYTVLTLRVKSLKKISLCTKLGRTCNIDFST